MNNEIKCSCKFWCMSIISLESNRMEYITCECVAGDYIAFG